MIKAKQTLIGRVSDKGKVKGKLSNPILNHYPDLENLEITPSGYEQKFNHPDSYGYDEITVKAVDSEELKITPSITEQVKEGLYKKVTVDGDENLVAENIKEGTSIFGVEGTAKTIDIKITNARSLFANGARLDYMNEFISLFDNITETAYMFQSCNNLTEIPMFDTSNVIYMNQMFYACSNLITIPNFDTSKVTLMFDMFNGCSKLTTIPNFDTSNVTDMASMFIYCKALTEIPSFDTSNVTNMANMFSGCSKLTTLPELDCSKTIAVNSIVSNCYALKNWNGLKNIGKAYTQKSNNAYGYAFSLSSNGNLTYESLINILNNLYDLNLTYDVANGGTLYTQKITLASYSKAKLTAEEIAIATNKGWTVS